jgi:tetratricopeptide (TPR) repeat protein
MPSSRPAAPAAKRRTRVPPALTRGAEAMPALGIVEEVAGELGVVLWRCARDVVLWASTPPARRSGLFTGTAAERRTRQLEALSVDPELAAPLAVMARLLESPAAIPERLLVNACRRLALWAEQQGHLATAVEFMQAGALVAPESAALAYAVGRLARRRAEYDRAESWYARAIVQARRGGKHGVYARAYSGIGNLYYQRGNFPAAKRAYLRCLKASDRFGLDELRGSAYHDLFGVELETGAGPDTEVFAELALSAYGANSRAVARLAFDVAYHWILRGRFSEALRVAQALAPHFHEAAERALVLSMIGRSAGGAGEAATFRDAAGRLDGLLRSGAGEDSAAPPAWETGTWPNRTPTAPSTRAAPGAKARSCWRRRPRWIPSGGARRWHGRSAPPGAPWSSRTVSCRRSKWKPACRSPRSSCPTPSCRPYATCCRS